MTPEDLKTLLEAGFENAEIQAGGDGSHFNVTIVTEQFEGMRAVKRQQTVYAQLGDKITSGEVHALSIKAYTPSEWQQAQKLQIG
jgi:acid stress-induced BolA-like protein IbaG/YrbA